jgi:hypothetical protein
MIDSRINRLVTTAVFLIPIAVIFFVFRRTVFFGEMYFDGDTVLNFYQYLYFFSHEGSVIAHTILAGFPVMVSAAGIWFYPVSSLMLRVLDPFDTYVYLNVANIVLAYIFTFAYARKIELNRYAAILAGLVYVFSGQMMMWATTLANTNYYFILPACVYFIEQAKRGTQRFLFLSLTGGILGLGWLSGHFQFIVYIHIFVAIYYFWIFWSKELGHLLRRSGYLTWMFGISFIVGYPQIRTSLDFIKQTARSSGVSLADFFNGTYVLQDGIHYFLPFWDNPIIRTSAPNIYLGILPIIFLIIGVISLRHIGRRHALFFTIVYFVTLFSAIKYSPLGLIFHYIPILDSFRQGQRILFIGNFAASMMVGLTAEYIVFGKDELRDRWNAFITIAQKTYYFVLLPIFLLATITELFFLDQIKMYAKNFFLKNIYERTAGLTQEHYFNLLDQYIAGSFHQISLRNGQVLVFVVFFLATFMLLKNRMKISSRNFFLIAILLTALNFSAVYVNRFQALSKDQLAAPSATVQFIQKQNIQEPFRVFSLFSGLIEFNELRVKCGSSSVVDTIELEKALLAPNLNMQFGIDSIDGYDNFMPERLAKLIGYIGSERATAGDLLVNEKIPIEARVAKFIERKNILRALNVRYVLSYYPITDPDFTLVFEETVSSCNIRVGVYELSRAWPRYFFTNQAVNVVGADDDALSMAVIKELQNEQKIGTIVFENQPSFSMALAPNPIVGEPLFAQITSRTISISVAAPTDGFVFLSNAWLSNWQAAIDGKQVEIVRANYAFMAVPITKGQHQLELFYR